MNGYSSPIALLVGRFCALGAGAVFVLSPPWLIISNGGGDTY